MATLPPSRAHLRASTWKDFHNFLNSFRCCCIRSAPPGLFLFTICHGHPPVHGIDAHSMQAGPYWLIFSSAILNAFLLVASISFVIRITSHPGRASFPIGESASQQNSIIALVGLLGLLARREP